MMTHMRLPFAQRLARTWSAQIADIGRVGTVVAFWAAIAVTSAEWFKPGVVGTVVPLELALGAVALFAALSLAQATPPLRRHVAVTTLIAIPLLMASIVIASLLFNSMPDLRPWVVTATTATVLTLIVSARHPE